MLFIACEIILAHGPEIDLFQTVKTIRCSFLFGHASSMAGTGQKGWSVGSDQKSQLAIITEGGAFVVPSDVITIIIITADHEVENFMVIGHIATILAQIFLIPRGSVSLGDFLSFYRND